MACNYIYKEEDFHTAVRYLNNLKRIGVDTETNGLDPLSNDILLLQMGNSEHQFVFDVHKLGGLINNLSSVLSNPTSTKIFHNAKFDIEFLRAKYKFDIKNIRCTMIENQLISAGRNIANNLNAVMNRHLGLFMAKETRDTFIDMPVGKDFTKDQITYAGADVEHLPTLEMKIESKINQRGMRELLQLEMETLHATCDLELNGIYLNADRWLKLKDTAEIEAGKAREALDKHFEPYCEKDMFGDLTINYNSPAQIRPILEQITGLSIPSTNVNILRKINHDVIGSLLKYREHMKRLTTYGQEFLNEHVSSVDSRVHSNFLQLGADSGRYASRNPNMTNIPSDQAYRSAFTSQYKDTRMISADFSGQELRLLAQLSREPKFLEAIEKGIDLHTNSASLIFDIDYDSVRKDQRTAAKSLTFGLIYGIGPKKLSDNLSISMQDARTLMNKYYRTFPKIKALLNELVEEASTSKIAKSPLDSRQRDLSTFDWDNPRETAHALNIAKNIPFQGAGASVTKKALCNLRHKIVSKGYKALLVNVIHDEIVVEVADSEAEEVAKMVEVEMTKAFNHYAPDVPMEVDAQIGDCWIKG